MLTANEIKTWLSEQDLSIKTLNRHLSYVQNIFNIAKSWGLIPTICSKAFSPLMIRIRGRSNIDA